MTEQYVRVGESLPLESLPYVRCTCCASILQNGRPRHRRAVARWVGQNGHVSLLCKSCLDFGFDHADDDESLEPAAWSWLSGGQPADTHTAIADAIRDPRHHTAVMQVIHREARRDPGWWRGLMRKEARTQGVNFDRLWTRFWTLA